MGDASAELEKRGRIQSGSGWGSASVVLFATALCLAVGWWASVGGLFWPGSLPPEAIVGGLIGLVLGLAVCLDDRSVQRRIKERMQSAAEQPGTTPQPAEAARRPSEWVALIMLMVPVAAGALIWRADFFHLTVRTAFLVGAGAVVLTAVLGYIDVRRLLLRCAPAALPGGRPMTPPPVVFCAILGVWFIGYLAHFVGRRRLGARNLIAPALVAIAAFLVPACMISFPQPTLPPVDSPQVLSIVENAVISSSGYQTRKEEFGPIAIRDAVELPSGKGNLRRVAQARLVSKLGGQIIFYTVEWQDRWKGKWTVRVSDR